MKKEDQEVYRKILAIAKESTADFELDKLFGDAQQAAAAATAAAEHDAGPSTEREKIPVPNRVQEPTHAEAQAATKQLSPIGKRKATKQPKQQQVAKQPAIAGSAGKPAKPKQLLELKGNKAYKPDGSEWTLEELLRFHHIPFQPAAIATAARLDKYLGQLPEGPARDKALAQEEESSD